MAFNDPYPSEKWPSNRSEVERLEFDWFCVDQAGQLGAFSSAGSGPIPEAVFRAGHTVYNELAAFFALRQQASPILVFSGTGDYSDWETYARHGLFAFDYQDVHRTAASERLGYDLIYRPSRPMLASDLPEHLQNCLSAVSAVFGDSDLIPTTCLPDLPTGFTPKAEQGGGDNSAALRASP